MGLLNQTATNQAPSKVRIALTWLLMVGMILFWLVFWLWRNHARTPTAEEETPHRLVSSILYLVIGAFHLVIGLGVYTSAIFTGCYTFNYRRVVWPGAKVRKWLVNIAATVLLGLGLGFCLSAFMSPMLSMAG